jgi:hypothetical protein
MGPDSIEQTKTDRLLTFIGYDIDLDKRLVTIDSPTQHQGFQGTGQVFSNPSS